MTLMQKEILESSAGLVRAAEANEETLNALGAELRAKRVKYAVIAARGTSDHAAWYAKYLIETYVGVPVALAAPSVNTVYEGKITYKNCLVVGISQSGRAEDVNAVLARAAENGAVTVSITNNGESLMAKTARYHLDCSQGEEKSVAATKTFVSQIYLCALLAAKWSRSARLTRELKNVPSVLEKTYALAPKIFEKAARYRFISDAFTLGRGYAYPLAMEFALKTQETCYVRNRAYPTSDFYHGPVAMVDDGTPVFLFALEQAMVEDAEKMLARLQESGADVFVFSPFEELIEKAGHGVRLPSKSAAEGVFSATAAMQLFACALALERGRNPDAPRGLSKVTITK